MVESHLAYADNVLLFCRASQRLMLTLRRILDDFTAFSGLQINVAKCHITLSSSATNKEEFTSIIGLPVRGLSFSYLGVPLIGRSLTSSDCETIISSFQAIIMRWNGRCLSYSRRAQLVQ